jgi:hypothetical protein
MTGQHTKKTEAIDLESSLKESRRQADMLQRYLNEASQARDQWRDIAKRLAENGGGLGRYSADKYLDSIDEYKRIAAMPNVASSPTPD